MVASNEYAGSRRSVRPAADCPVRPTGAQREALYDATLVRRFNDGDESAFEEIMTRYREKMYAIAYSVLRNSADAEEIAQDTFVRAHRGLARFRGDSALATWLHRIALNLSRNRYWYFFRRNRHLTRSIDSVFGDSGAITLAQLIACEAPDPVQAAATSEFSEIILTCMERLAPGHREILVRRNVQNCSYQEIAAALHISLGTVKSRIARARLNLRALLAGACPEFAPDAALSDWFAPTRNRSGVELACA
jgi:RNA polymerase sigma-70 factor (ECF subfamily)